MAEDFPTLERPAKAISGKVVRGMEESFGKLPNRPTRPPPYVFIGFKLGDAFVMGRGLALQEG